MKRIINQTTLLVLIGLLASCSANYRMTTRVHEDGTMDREVYALADSAFLAGDRSKNPFLFQLGNDWTVENLDSCTTVDFFGEKEKQNVKAFRTGEGRKATTFFSPKAAWMEPLAVPQEKLEKYFRWFYTYYTYTCDFREITEKGPVPIDRYLSKSEQALLFQGDISGYRGMNGIELKNELDDIEQKFLEWFYHTQFELSYEVVEQFLQKSGDVTRLEKIKKEKREVFERDENRKKEDECSPQYVCTLLDKRYETDFFTDLYKVNEKEMQQVYEEKCITMELFGYQIKFELAMPGELLSANTSLRENDRLVWKVDAYRLLGGNYVLKAESRVMNWWAFCVTGLLIVLVGYGLIKSSPEGKILTTWGGYGKGSLKAKLERLLKK